MTSASRAVRDLTRAALVPDRPGTVSELLSVVAEATGSVGAVLWEAPDEQCGDSTLSVLALGMTTRTSTASTRPAAADAASRIAHECRSLALAADVDEPTQVYGNAVTAALPIDYADGCRGVLTLLGGHELTPSAFDAAVEILDVLPALCTAVRERQTLELANACNAILHDADVESPDQPLSEDRLSEHLSEVCERVSDVLRCPEVSIFLRDPADRGISYRWFAGTGRVGDGRLRAEPTQLLRSGLGGEQPLMEVRMLSGDQVNGLLRCAGSNGPPQHFTASDFAIIRPIATQVSRYWRGWLRRRAMRDENESWRGLAAGMTSFNKVIAERLRVPTPDGALARDVSEMAGQIVRDVVPGSTDARVLLAEEIADDTYLPAAQDEGQTAARWRLQTPIRAGEKVYGVLEGGGPGVAPPHSEQVHEIIADQVGLHRHLQDTLVELHCARLGLEEAVRNEADAMENLKHQLVSPLRTAANRTELVLTSRRFDRGIERELRAVRGLCRKASRVAMSAGVFATLAKGERPTARSEAFGGEDLLRLLIAAADDAQALGDPRRKITFDVERESLRGLGRRLVVLDESFLQQCMGNLLDNAAKYSYDGTAVQIDAGPGAGNLTIAVNSTGLPLTKSDVARCRERNWRGNAARNTTGEGSGIGLWIADNLMCAMRGHLDIEASGDRTTVRLVLPLT